MIWEKSEKVSIDHDNMGATTSLKSDEKRVHFSLIFLKVDLLEFRIIECIDSTPCIIRGTIIDHDDLTELFTGKHYSEYIRDTRSLIICRDDTREFHTESIEKLY